MLLIAHDFPPVRSPQSIRAKYFAKALLDAGARVTVLTRTASHADPADGLVRSLVERGLEVARCSPGLLEAGVDWWSQRRSPKATGDADVPSPDLAPGHAQLNWKGRLVQQLRRALGVVWFPDARSAWTPHARRWLQRRLASGPRYDAAILMHEPAAGILLWEQLEQASVPWLVDLADPVLAPYTPWHWRRRARRVEAALLARAHAVCVTNEGTRTLLRERHAPAPSRATWEVLPQGYEARAVQARRATGPLVLLYTGRFYAFRPAEPLLDAVAAVPGVRLRIAGPEMPAPVIAAAARHPDRIELLGEVDHDTAIRLQDEADVLVSVGNRGTPQTPGKTIEYLGARRPILHLWQDAPDEPASMLAGARRGMACRADAASVAEALAALRRMADDGGLPGHFDLEGEALAEFSWPCIGAKLAALLTDLIEERAGR